LGQDIQNISDKMKKTRFYVKEHAILTKENARLVMELNHF